MPIGCRTPDDLSRASILFTDRVRMPESGLSNDDGKLLVRQLLRPRLPHDLHDYIIEGLCKAVDGVHVLLVVKTGSGKTGLFYGYILIIHALKKIRFFVSTF